MALLTSLVLYSITSTYRTGCVHPLFFLFKSKKKNACLLRIMYLLGRIAPPSPPLCLHETIYVRYLFEKSASGDPHRVVSVQVHSILSLSFNCSIHSSCYFLNSQSLHVGKGREGEE